MRMRRTMRQPGSTERRGTVIGATRTCTAGGALEWSDLQTSPTISDAR